MSPDAFDAFRCCAFRNDESADPVGLRAFRRGSPGKSSAMRATISTCALTEVSSSSVPTRSSFPLRRNATRSQTSSTSLSWWELKKIALPADLACGAVRGARLRRLDRAPMSVRRGSTHLGR